MRGHKIKIRFLPHLFTNNFCSYLNKISTVLVVNKRFKLKTICDKNDSFELAYFYHIWNTNLSKWIVLVSQKRKKQKQIKQGNGRIIEKKVKMFPRWKAWMNLTKCGKILKGNLFKGVFFITFRPFTVSLQTNMRSC